MAQIPFVGPSYQLDSRPASVQRTINLVPYPQEPGNERTKWVFKDVPGLVAISSAPVTPTLIAWLDAAYTAPGGGNGPTAGNNGVLANWWNDANSQTPTITFYAQVIGWTSETVVWTPTWAPLAAEPTPVVTNIGSGAVSVTYSGTVPGNYITLERGLLTLTATINGTPAADSLTIASSIGGSGYGAFAWAQV
jgi:hypothetical protein